jgi:hypothetical protein
MMTEKYRFGQMIFFTRMGMSAIASSANNLLFVTETKYLYGSLISQIFGGSMVTKCS